MGTTCWYAIVAFMQYLNIGYQRKLAKTVDFHLFHLIESIEAGEIYMATRPSRQREVNS
jgi:hypothetical protein